MRRADMAWHLRPERLGLLVVLAMHAAALWGLWLWPMLFIFPRLSVRFNLRSVYELVTRTLFEYQS